MLSKLQYISEGKTAKEQLNHIAQALDHGADWIQIRWKNVKDSDFLILGHQVMKLCQQYNAVCIINDALMVAKELDADGIHLGLADTSVAEARSLLGRKKIIGGTANTLDDIIQRKNEGCNYIGLGPFRFTTSKEKLSPILGLKGYQTIFQSLEKMEIVPPPIFAIGGIKLEDIQELHPIGIYGVALSGLINKNPQSIINIKSKLQ